MLITSSMKEGTGVTFPEPVLTALNAAGLGLLGVGLYFVYRAFAARSELLQQSIGEIKSDHKLIRESYESIIESIEKRRVAVDQQFDDVTKFHQLFLSVVGKSKDSMDIVSAWHQDQIVALTAQLTEMRKEIAKYEERIRELNAEKQKLADKLAEAKRDLDGFKQQVARLTTQVTTFENLVSVK